MTATAKAHGAVGAVVDGFHRDTPQVLEQDFPVFSRGNWAQDSGPRMKVADFRTAIEIAGISVAPGDLVFGDIDGVLVVPNGVVDEVIVGAVGEGAWREDGASGDRVGHELDGGVRHLRHLVADGMA